MRQQYQRILLWVVVIGAIGLTGIPWPVDRPLDQPLDLPLDAPLDDLPDAPIVDDFTGVPDEVLDLVGEILPEYSNAGASYVSSAYSPNLIISADATVEVIFVHEGAGYRNSFGWFSYTEGVDGITITDADLIWEDASFPSAGTMDTGDTATLLDDLGDPRVFTDGERVGFFVVANGWNQESEVRNWDPENPTLPKTTPAANAAVSGGKGCYTSLEKLNPEYDAGDIGLARHLAMIKVDGIAGFLGGEDFILSGFEDLNRNRGSDDDFNDLVFIVNANPLEAIEETDVFVYEEGDPDGDGIEGIDDHFPNDGERAFLQRYPSHGYTVVGFEDLYPNRGDADFNDVGLAYAFEVVTHANGKVKDIVGDFHLITRGAGLDHALGMHFPDMDADAAGTIDIERFLSDDDETVENLSRSIQSMIANDSRRIADVFPSTQAALPSQNSVFTNTNTNQVEREAASARVKITFDSPVSKSTVGNAPYDLYFGIPSSKGIIDIHFPGYEGFADRPDHLPEETGESSFMDDGGFPWLIEIPTNWAVPLEKVHIETAYPDFETWRTSGGSSKQTWYLNPGSANTRSASLADLIPVREWTVNLPSPD